MAILNKDELKQGLNNTFTDGGAATAQEFRDFNNDLIDSTSSQGDSSLKTVTLFGDSFSFYQKDTSNNDAVIAASCWSFILSDLSGVVDVNGFAGIGGNNSSQMLARLQADVLNVGSDFVFGQVGVNDFYGFNFTAQQVFDNVTNMIDQIVANGQSVIWLNCPPQNVARSGFSAAKSLESTKYNSMLEDWAKSKVSVTIVDVYSDMVDRRDNTNGAAKNDVISTDNIHLSVLGAITYSESFNRDTAHIFSKSKNKATSSPLDSNLVNGSFSGTSGVLGTNASGVVPDDFILSAQTNVSAAGSVNQEGFEVVSTCTSAVQNYFRIQSFNLSGSFSGGESVKLKASIDIYDNDLSINEIRFYIYSASGAQFSTGDWGRVINGYTETNPFSKSINIETNPYTIESLPDDVRVYADIRFTGTGACGVRFKTMLLEVI